MGITSAMYTAMSGLTANQSKLDVVGNNIANVNTIGFKTARFDFKTQFSETFSDGSAPNGDLGGTNPLQVGLGVQAGAISRNFNNGSLEVTGVDSNLAIQGDGFFVVKDSTQVYTRDGSFKLNSLNQLVNGSGMFVQGYGVDSNFNITPGVLGNITIPVGALTVATATQNATVQGNLDGNGTLPSQVSSLQMLQDLYVSNGAGGVTGTAPTAATPLSLLADSSGNSYFSASDILTLTGKVGGRTVPTQSLSVTPSVGPASTLGDLISFVNGTFGIDTSAGANGSIATLPGATLVAGPAGAVDLQVNGNPGTENDITLDTNSLTGATGPAGSFSWNPLTTGADGASAHTSTTVYDSLGNAVTANITASLIGRSSTGSTWQFYATSPDGTATGASVQALIGSGTLTFDVNGVLTGATNTAVTIDRSNTGANPNLTFNLDFTNVSGQSPIQGGSSLAVPLQDGSPAGTLVGYSIDNSGIIKGAFSAGPTRTLGQIALATFRNNQGLVDKGDNTFAEGPNSGTAVISAPGQFSAGLITSGSLELSNVDLSNEFVQLISASTGFSASSRVITTSNQLLQELLSASR